MASSRHAGRVLPSLTTAWTLAIAAHLFWGFLAPGGKVLLEWWGPWTLNAVRMLAATVVVALFYGREETSYGLKALLVDKQLLILGVVGIGFTFWAYLVSIQYIEATVAGVLIFLAPFLTAAIARVTIGERTGWWLWVAALGALFGAWLTLLGPAEDLGSIFVTNSVFGIVVNLIAVVLWAVYSVHLKVMSQRYPVGRLTVASFAAATLFFVAGAAGGERFGVDWTGALSPLGLVYLMLYIVFPSALAYVFYAMSIDRVGAGPITLLLGIELLATALLAHLTLGETFPPLRILGLVLTTATVVWFVAMQSRVGRPPDEALAEPI